MYRSRTQRAHARTHIHTNTQACTQPPAPNTQIHQVLQCIQIRCFDFGGAVNRPTLSILGVPAIFSWITVLETLIYQRNKSRRAARINSLELNPRSEQILLAVVWLKCINILVRKVRVQDLYLLGYTAVYTDVSEEHFSSICRAKQ
jgi:hypothetical protein